MKKFTCIVLILLFVSAVLTSCGTIITENSERDMKQTIIEVNGVKILKEQFASQYNNYVYQYYYSYGISPNDSTYQEMFSNLANQILDGLVANEINNQKAKALGYYDKLTAEEKAACKKEADDAIEEAIQSNAQALASAAASATATPTPTPSATATPTATPKASRTAKPAPTPTPTAEPVEDKYVKQAREEYLSSLEESGSSLDKIYEQYYMDKAIEKMKDDLSKEAAKVTDEALKEYYNQQLTDQKASFDKDATAVEEYTSVIVYYPKGYSRVKNLLIKIDDTASSAISSLRKEAETAKTSAESEKDETKKAEYQKTYEEKTAEADAKLAEELTTIQARADEILAKVKAGEDFDKLIQEYNEDPGMFVTDDETGDIVLDDNGKKTVIADKDAYLVSKDTTTYLTAFTDASVALKNVGDTSALVATDYGYHIIKKVASYDGEVKLADVKEALTDELIKAKKDEYLTNLAATWRKEAKVVIYKDRLSDLVVFTD